MLVCKGMDKLNEVREDPCSLKYQDHTPGFHFCSLIDKFPGWYSEPCKDVWYVDEWIIFCIQSTSLSEQSK